MAIDMGRQIQMIGPAALRHQHAVVVSDLSPDFFQLASLMCRDALVREESCGGHFRVEHQTEEGEALRDDEHFAHVTAWEWTGDPSSPTEHREQLEYEVVKFQTRSYK